MKIIGVVLGCFVFALAFTACTETAPPTNSPGATTAVSPAQPVDPFAASRTNYQKNCEPCHGPAGEGGLVKVDNKQIKVPSLKGEHALKRTEDQLTKMITTGEEEMPAFKDKLSEQEISDMVKFVRHQFQGKD